MTAEETRRLIDASGGTKAFALLMDIATPGYPARIGQWKRRGFPPKWLDANREKIATLKMSASRRGLL